MAETAETITAQQHDAHSPEPIKSTVVSRGLISIPDGLAFWRRWWIKSA